jgi:periplasmic protein TonB
MKTQNNVYSSMDDIVFENRNKEYGAYAIRKTYSDNVTRASILVFGSSLILIAFSFVRSEQPIPVLPKLVPFTSLGELPVILPREELKPKTTSIRKTPSKLTPKPTQQSVPEQNLAIVEPSVGSELGTDEGIVDFPGPSNGTSTETIVEPAVVVPPRIYDRTEIMPSYTGGMEAMMKYLQRNVHYPAIARRMEVEGAVYVSFIIDMNGQVTNAAIVKGISKECDAEALRVIANMPAWSPGKQGGAPVMVRMILPIRFKLNRT